MTKTKIVEVIENFYDKVAGVDRSFGETFEVDQERAEVLLGANDYHRPFVVVEEAPTGQGNQSDAQADQPAPPDYSKLKTAELKALLTERGLAFDEGAKKADLLALLMAE